MTGAERKIWLVAKSLDQFRHNELLNKSGTTNKKAVSRMLKKAQQHGVLVKLGQKYVVQAGQE